MFAEFQLILILSGLDLTLEQAGLSNLVGLETIAMAVGKTSKA